MTLDLEAAKRLCEAATPGPWTPSVWIETDGNEWRATGPGHEDHAHDYGPEPGSPDERAAQRDAQFIAASRQLLPDLIAEVERLRTRQQELLATIVRLTNETPYPDEAANWTEQRAKLLAEIGTLKAKLAGAKR